MGEHRNMKTSAVKLVNLSSLVVGIAGGRVEKARGRNMSFDSVRDEKLKTVANYGFSYGYGTVWHRDSGAEERVGPLGPWP